MQKLIRQALILGTALSATACGNTPDPTQRPPSFLPNYSLLKAMPSPNQDTQIYSYKAPNVNRSDYNAAIVNPVTLYQGAAKDGVTNQKIEHARVAINAVIIQIVSKKLQITNTPGPGVLRLQVAITGASLQPEGFKPWNVIPISAAIKLASMATGTESKQPILVVELKFTDSQTGNLIKETVTTISGAKLSSNSNLTDAFDKLATTWVQEALKYSN